ncbi:hypothetical protein N566_22035 [Streptomycetaceae bacterium MP113-05]|nr:hypothetical protein N566_22035 [Streptomycetaceae bacterium MP113-05]
MSRHRFEPARLLMGLMLCGAATAYLLDVADAVDLHPLLLALTVPAALALGLLVATVTFATRRTGSRRAGARAGDAARPGAGDPSGR